MWSLLAAGAVLVALAACGDALIDEEYRGEALMSLNGPIVVTNAEQAAERAFCDRDLVECEERCERGECALEECYIHHDDCLAENGVATNDELVVGEINLGVSLFWSGRGDGLDVVEQVSVITPGLPSRYSLTLYQPPPASALATVGGDQYAVGVLLAYDDADRNGRLDPTRETLLGGAADAVVLYTPNGIDQSGIGQFAPGFHRVDPVEGACGTGVPGARFVRAEEPRAQAPITFGAPEEALGLLLLDVNCDGDLDEWDLCTADAALLQCASRTPSAACAICLGLEDPDDGEDGEEGEDDPDDPDPKGDDPDPKGDDPDPKGDDPDPKDDEPDPEKEEAADPRRAAPT